MTEPSTIKLPLTIGADGRSITIEQGTDAEILQGLEVVARYRPGVRAAAPDFGVPDLAHQQGGPNLTIVSERLELWEPRVRSILERIPLDSQGLSQRILIKARRAAPSGP